MNRVHDTAEGRTMEITTVMAQLRTTDLAASIRFYTALPGFTLAFLHADFYAGIRVGTQMFHLKLVDEQDPSIVNVIEEGHLHLYFETADVQMDVPHRCPCRQAVPHDSGACCNDAIDVERIGCHHEFAPVALPSAWWSIGVDLDAQTVRIREVQRLAD